MTKKEREILKQAANIIAKELSEGREVRILNFGMFRLSRIAVSMDHPLDDEGVFGVDYFQKKVSFRPFKLLKEMTRHRVRPCRKVSPKRCWHSEGEGHEGSCLNYYGKPL